MASCMIAGTASARDPIPPPMEVNAEIVSLSQNNMYPKAVGTVTFMQGCGDQFLNIQQTMGQRNDMGIRELKVEVKLLRDFGAVCLAMPQPVTKNFSINTMDGPVVLVEEFSAPQSDIAINCAVDERPFDGNFRQIQLVRQANSLYKVIYNMATAGFGAPPQQTSVILGTNLKCAFGVGDGMLSSCRKSGRDYGEATNSGFVSKRVATTGVSDDGFVSTVKTVGIVVYSPELRNNTGGHAYPPQEPYPGRAHLKFPADSCVAL